MEYEAGYHAIEIVLESESDHANHCVSAAIDGSI
jgi:hypothetical protein